MLNEFPITDLPGNAVQVALGDAYGSERRKLVAKFHLRPVAATGKVDVATLTIRWAATTGDIALHTVTVPVVITAGVPPDDLTPVPTRRSPRKCCASRSLVPGVRPETPLSAATTGRLRC